MTLTPSQPESARRPVNVFGGAQLPEAPDDQSYRFSDQRIVQYLDAAVASSPTLDQLLENISRIISEQSDCLGLWACQAKENGEFGSTHQLTESEGEALWTVVEDHAREMINRVAKTRQICSSPVQSPSRAELVVAPVSTDVEGKMPVQLMLVACFSAENQSVLRQQWLAGLVSQSISRWHQHRTLKHQEIKTRGLNDTIGLVHTLDQTTSISEASMVITNHLRKLCQAEQVAISFCEQPGRGTLKAVSDVEQIDLSSESSKIINNACNQAIITGAASCFPAPDLQHSTSQLALDKYCKANGLEACVNLPLITEDNRTIGSILIASPAAKMNDENYRQYLNQMVKMATGHLDVVMRANRGVRDVLKTGWQKVRSANLTRAILIGIACFIAVMLVPLPYRVACECELQPVMRRYVASPHVGILKKTFVESGDLIEAEQVLANLDGRQLRMEISGLRAEHEGARKRRDSSLALGDIAPSQIAKSEMQRHRAKMDILEQQLTDLEVRSPIAGIVVSGDLEKVEGAPLEMGQTLFEIAPLDEMLAEIGIPESEIRYVEPGMQVAIKLNAFPFRTWTGTVQQIHPRTEIIDDESVFVAHVALRNPEYQLRPGMKGSAKIKTHLTPIGWNLFHESWESIRYWMIW